MKISKRLYESTVDAKDIFIFTLSNDNGMSAEISNLGGVIISLCVPDKSGKVEDITLGFDKLEDYLKQGPFFGALIGRVANRIENAVFEINGIEYIVAKNDGKNHLHGGTKGFDKVVWQSEIIKNELGEALQLTYKSIDSEENYPGTLDVKVIYSLSEDNGLRIDYSAVSDKDTAVNLTNHAYFNLAGHASGNILNHILMINADKFTPINDQCIPTGEIREVKGSVMDFTKPTQIAPGIASGDEQIACGGGYDHNWVLNTKGNLLEIAAEVYDSYSGRLMDVYTTKPGVQLYSGNFIDGATIGKSGVVYKKHGGLCLETQYFPNALKHKHFPSPLLRAGEKYNHTTIFKFSTK
jgi:aldose 1-epimerase